MKRLVVLAVLAIAVAVVIGELGDLTQSRPDAVREHVATEIVLTVAEDRFGPGRDAAAAALWAVCSGQTRSAVAGDGSPDVIAAGRYRVVLEPAIGHHEQRKLVGCLEDLTVDRVLAEVESFRTVPTAG